MSARSWIDETFSSSSILSHAIPLAMALRIGLLVWNSVGCEVSIFLRPETCENLTGTRTMLKRTRTSAYTPKAVERLGEIESLINHAGSALNGIKVLVSLEKWVL